ncbi:PEP-CTERM sorting domain-containing protein [Roseateles sp.]|uniref:PEP-CTERM sorting domain-containing protein n=1 Tax=Roseateles sp. TaxID=1971397 RepID=UPI003BA50F8B
MKSAGRVGFEVFAKGDLGKVSAKLDYAQAFTVKPGGNDSAKSFSITRDVNNFLGGSFSQTAAQMQVALNGTVGISNSTSFRVCVFDCSSSHVNFDVPTTNVSLFKVDTSKNPPLSIAGQPINGFVYGKDYGINVTGPGVQKPDLGSIRIDQLKGAASTDSRSLTYRETLLTTKANLTGMLQSAVGQGGTDMFSPKVSLGEHGHIEGTMVDAQLGLAVGLKQSLSLKAGAAPTLTLKFSKPVQRGYKDKDKGPWEWTAATNEIKFDEDGGQSKNTVEFRYAGEVGELLSWSYSMEDTVLGASTALTLDPTLSVEAGCFDIRLLNFAMTGKCAYEGEAFGKGLFEIPVKGMNSAKISGWNKETFYVNAAPVPEPESYLLMLAGLGAIAYVARRRSAKTTA